MTSLTAFTRDGSPWLPIFVDGIDGARCLGCGRCYKVCGQGVLEMRWIDEEGAFVEADDGDAERMVMTVGQKGRCIGCGACVRVCSKNAQRLVPADAA